MIGLTNMQPDDLKNTDAILIVTVPTGSTVTATKIGTTLTPTIWVQSADNSFDIAFFSISSSTFDANAWTITATLNGKTASDTIIIDSAKEYSLEITYNYWIFRSGIGAVLPLSTANQSHSTIQIGTQSIYSSYSSVDYAQVACWATSKINLEPYSTFHIIAEVDSYRNANGYRPLICLASSTPAADEMNNISKYFAQSVFDVSGEIVENILDISAITSTSFVAFQGTFNGKVTDMFLQK